MLRSVITGELRSKIDRLWDAFWSGGISNPLEVIEQITYLMFIKRLDSIQTTKEHKANRTEPPGDLIPQFELARRRIADRR